ncbi:unnamed protein product [Cylicocyclus nassatus]|uniref:Uncharacterized protein n=1 Tax=Cylicocyclus nassatus TaxID=53992 RepID=A0AA36DSM2_CYLNA|nr:unnamed protein product [Cylicocyclus nassatus]
MNLFLISFLLFPFLAGVASVPHTHPSLNKCDQRQCQQFCDKSDNGRYKGVCYFLEKEGLRYEYCRCNEKS